MRMKNGIIVLILGGLLAAVLFIAFHIGEPGFGLFGQSTAPTGQTGDLGATTTATTTPESEATTTATTTPSTPGPSSGSMEEMGNVNGIEVVKTPTEPSPGTNVTTLPPSEGGGETTPPPPETTPPPTTTTTTTPPPETGTGTSSSGTTTETTPPPEPPPTPTSHLVGYYTFDNTSGTIVTDSSEYGNNGVVTNSENPLWGTGHTDGALDFDGIDDYVDIPHTSSLDLGAVGQSYTVSVWFKKSQITSGEHEIVAKGGRSGTLPFAIRVNGSGDPSFRISDGMNSATAVSNDSIVSGAWYHLVGVRDAVNHRIYLYINGVGIDSVNDPTTESMQNTSDITLDHYEGINGYEYDTFAVDDLRIYNRTLTSDEVKQLYQGVHISD